MEHQEKTRRSSVAALIGALALSLPFYPYLVFVFALSASDSGTGAVVAIFVVPAIGWVILAAYVVPQGPRQPIELPFNAFAGSIFPSAWL